MQQKISVSQMCGASPCAACSCMCAFLNMAARKSYLSLPNKLTNNASLCFSNQSQHFASTVTLHLPLSCFCNFAVTSGCLKASCKPSIKSFCCVNLEEEIVQSWVSSDSGELELSPLWFVSSACPVLLLCHLIVHERNPVTQESWVMREKNVVCTSLQVSFLSVPSLFSCSGLFPLPSERVTSPIRSKIVLQCQFCSSLPYS